jgi:site-specific recombinase XerD
MHYARVTQTLYLKALRQYVDFIGKRSIARADHTDIRLSLAQASENGATLGTAYRYLGVLRQFYDFLNLGGVVDYVAPRFVRLRVPWHGRANTLTEAQIRRLISVAEAVCAFSEARGQRFVDGYLSWDGSLGSGGRSPTIRMATPVTRPTISAWDG